MFSITNHQGNARHNTIKLPQTHYDSYYQEDKRYQVQLSILNELEKKIKTDGSLVTKEYVKGRENIYTHPAIGEYNKTSTSANQTVATLIKIIKSLRNEEDGGEGEDELLAALGIR